MKYNDDAIHLPTGAEVTILRELDLADSNVGTVVLFQFDGGATGLAFRHDILPVFEEPVPADTVVSIRDIVHEVVSEIVDEEAAEAEQARRQAIAANRRREEEQTAAPARAFEPQRGDTVTVGKGKQVWTVAENDKGWLNLTRIGSGRTKLQANANNVTKVSS